MSTPQLVSIAGALLTWQQFGRAKGEPEPTFGGLPAREVLREQLDRAEPTIAVDRAGVAFGVEVLALVDAS